MLSNIILHVQGKYWEKSVYQILNDSGYLTKPDGFLENTWFVQREGGERELLPLSVYNSSYTSFNRLFNVASIGKPYIEGKAGANAINIMKELIRNENNSVKSK